MWIWHFLNLASGVLPFSLLFLRRTIPFQYVIYYCQIQLGLTKHFTAAKQPEEREHCRQLSPADPSSFAPKSWPAAGSPRHSGFHHTGDAGISLREGCALLQQNLRLSWPSVLLEWIDKAPDQVPGKSLGQFLSPQQLTQSSKGGFTLPLLSPLIRGHFCEDLWAPCALLSR